MSDLMLPTGVDCIPIKIRRIRMADYPLIYNSWIRSFVDSQASAPLFTGPFIVGRKEAENPLSSTLHKKIETLIERGVDISIACNPEDEDQIFGWMCSMYNLIYYIYVKTPFKQQKIATRLLRELPFNLDELVMMSWTIGAEDAVGELNLKRGDF